MRRSSDLAMRRDFQPRRWTCHVPRMKAVMGMRAVHFRRRDGSLARCFFRAVRLYRYSTSIWDPRASGEKGCCEPRIMIPAP